MKWRRVARDEGQPGLNLLALTEESDRNNKREEERSADPKLARRHRVDAPLVHACDSVKPSVKPAGTLGEEHPP